MRIALIFNATRPDTTGIYVERACRMSGIETHRWSLGARGEIPAGFDLYLRIDHGDDYDVRLPAHLRPVVFYAIDTHLRHSWKKIRRAARAYDWVFCAHWNAAQRLPNASWLPLACDAELHGSIGEVDTPRDSAPPSPTPADGRGTPARSMMWDVAFVGTDGGVPRKFYLQALRERYPNSYIGTAEHTQMASIYGRARIGFNYSIAHDVNMRVFEALAAKTLLVTNALPGDDFDRLGLHDRRHLVCYRSPKELIELVDGFLANAEERKRVAEQGHAVVMARHTYLHRLRELLTTLGLSYPSRCIPQIEPRVLSHGVT